MADSDAGEKSEEPTGKRLSEARDKGQIAKSPELMTAAALLGSGLTMSMAGPTLWRFLIDSMGQSLRTAGDVEHRDLGMITWTQTLSYRTMVAMIGVLGSMAMIAIIVQAMQTGGLLTTTPLEPKWSRLNPLNNVKQLIGKRTLVELTKSLLKLVIVGSAVYATLRNAWPDVQALALLSPVALMGVVEKYGMGMLRNAGLMFVALAGADYAWVRFTTHESLKMTKQEVKEESNSQEGDPEIKGRRRALGRERLRRLMFANVRTADVVIVNPVHVAVAIKYDPNVAPAPYVVALGQRKIAQRIKELAFQHGVPVIENKPLARALLASTKVGTMIPMEMYLAVAEVLAFVMKQRSRYGKSWRGTAAA